MERRKPIDRDKVKEFVRNILTNDFKQEADEALIDGIAERVLKVLPLRTGKYAG